IAGIELHAERRDVRAKLERRRRELRALVAHRELRIRNVALVAIRITEMLADPGDMVELVARYVVAEPVARILGEPVVAGARIDVAADAVAHAKRDDFRKTVGRIDAPDLRYRGRRQADVAGRTERDVKPAVLVEGQIFPAMRRVGRHVVVDDLPLRHL